MNRLHHCLFVGILLVLFTFLISSCQESIQSDTDDLKTIESEIDLAKGLVQGVFDDVWGGLDSTKIENYHTDDFIILEQGAIWSNQEIKDYIKKSLSREDETKRINRMEWIKTDHYGETINMAYRNYATFMVGDSIVGQAQWLESAMAVKDSNKWKLQMMHSTWVPMDK